MNKILDRVRKLLALSKANTSEAEAALAAANAAKLIEEYQLSEAQIRLEDPQAKPEPIIKGRLEDDCYSPLTAKDEDMVVRDSKRVAWKEAISAAVANSLGVKTYYWSRHQNGRMRHDVRGMGRESAIQTWRYTWQFLCRQVEDLCDEAWKSYQEFGYGTSVKAWKNAFRVACAARIAERLNEATAAKEAAWKLKKVEASQALTIVDQDRDEVESEYTAFMKGSSKIAPAGQVSSRDGFNAGFEAGDRVSLGGQKTALTAGQGRLTE